MQAPPEQMQDPPEHVDANFQISAHLFWIFIKLTSSPPCWQCMHQGENAEMQNKAYKHLHELLK
jgi:hypothetical protein